MKKNQKPNKLESMKPKESEEIFRSFSKQSLVGVCLIEEDNFIYVNPKFADIFGYKKTIPCATKQSRVLLLF